jgi:hypothetical protein
MSLLPTGGILSNIPHLLCVVVTTPRVRRIPLSPNGIVIRAADVAELESASAYSQAFRSAKAPKMEMQKGIRDEDLRLATLECASFPHTI